MTGNMKSNLRCNCLRFWPQLLTAVVLYRIFLHVVAPPGGARLNEFSKFLNSTRKYWRNSCSIPYDKIELKLRGGKKTF